MRTASLKPKGDCGTYAITEAVFCWGVCCFSSFRDVLQNLHLIAFACISSEQYGQFFVVNFSNFLSSFSSLSVAAALSVLLSGGGAVPIKAPQ